MLTWRGLVEDIESKMQIMKARYSDESVPHHIPRAPVARLEGHEGPIHSVRFSHNGKYCLTAGQDRSVRLWNPTRIDPASNHSNSSSTSSLINSQSTEKPLSELPQALPIQTYTDGYTHPITAITSDTTSHTLLSTSHKVLVVSDLPTAKLKRRFFGHTAQINTVACTDGGDCFITGSYDGTVRLWDGRNWSSGGNAPLQILEEATDSVSCVCVSGDDILVGSVDGVVRTYDVRMGRMWSDEFGSDGCGGVVVTDFDVTNQDGGLCCAVSCLNGDVHLLERSSGELLKTISNSGNERIVGNYALECSFTADDEYIVCGSEDGKAFIYEVQSGGKVIQCLEGHTRPTCSVACHPQKERASILITGSYDGIAVVWSNDLELDS